MNEEYREVIRKRNEDINRWTTDELIAWMETLDDDEHEFMMNVIQDSERNNHNTHLSCCAARIQIEKNRANRPGLFSRFCSFWSEVTDGIAAGIVKSDIMSGRGIKIRQD